jgi:DNA topoisomerase II
LFISNNSIFFLPQGEASLQGAIVGMAQTYVGANNINLLMPNGQFGTRLQGGKDAGSARYIHTALNPVTSALFAKSDEAILRWCDDDGAVVEPKHYLPILPMILINGACGIGTGFSVQVPCYRPSDVVGALRRLLDGADPEDLPELEPWYRGFTGRVVKIGEGRWMSVGAWERTSPTRVRIKDLPIGVWTEDYKLFLEDLVEKNADVKGFEPEYTDEVAAFSVVFASPAALDARMRPSETHAHLLELELDLRLSSTKGLSTTNMYLFDDQGRVCKYASATHILAKYYEVRLEAYGARKTAVIAALESDLVHVSAKARFVQDVVAGVLGLMGAPRADVEAQLRRDGFPAKSESYDYLLNMPAHSFTAERTAQLLQQRGDMEAELSRVRGLSPSDMWREELRVLDEQFSDYF